KDEDKVYKIAWIRFYRDSTKYIYGWNYDFRPDQSGYGHPARYKGDIREVAEAISRDVAKVSIQAPFDSVLVFQAVVRKKYDKATGRGPFELEDLIYGKPSA